MTTIPAQASIAPKTIACTLEAEKIQPGSGLRGLPSLPQLTGFFSGLPYPSILKANNSPAGHNRFSVWCAWPKEIFIFHHADDANPFAGLTAVLDKYRLLQPPARSLPAGLFCGGWMGFFGYELGRYIEKLPHKAIDDLGLPLIRLCFYDRAVCYDHIEKSWWLLALNIEGDPGSASEKIAQLKSFLGHARSFEYTPPPRLSIENISTEDFHSSMSEEYYRQAFEKILRHIRDGDVYQINFSRRFDCDYHAKPVELYHWQNAFNPSPYAAFVDAGEFAVVSASPEMFIKIENGFITTTPIKGTRPRLTDGTDFSAINRKNRRQLLQSPKEQAELNMIIDLERNDIAKICLPGTRSVIRPPAIYAHPTVFHTCATIGGRLRHWNRLSDFTEVLKAMFPGGSITGAPKISAMKIIDALEPIQRGVYTGAIGYLGLDNTVCLNIAIRTVIITQSKAFVQTGGAIVADSTADAEWQETITKARALLAGIAAVSADRQKPLPASSARR